MYDDYEYQCDGEYIEYPRNDDRQKCIDSLSDEEKRLIVEFKRRINNIYSLLDSKNAPEEQEKGLALAREVEEFEVFIRPETLYFDYNIWDNCVKILIEKTNEQLKPYFTDLLFWMSDMTTDAIVDLVERLKLMMGNRDIIAQFKVVYAYAGYGKNYFWLHFLKQLKTAIPLTDEDYKGIASNNRIFKLVDGKTYC